MKYNPQDDKILDKIKRIIIDTVSPEKIILFGSRARGEITKNSDYDILIIKDNIKNERTLTKKINYELLNEHFMQEIDLIAATTEKWKRNINNIGYIYKQINLEGIVLYG
ncbi:MAG: nucleotidyltransferase domain-containing protein [Candidatus Cloacimonetes bacterium]|nr:nucleotidyltransferase domain-containing protein [Candidatus Cloacimonadota bacterium]